MIEYYRGLNEEGKPFVTEVELDFEPKGDDAVWMLWAFAKLKTPTKEGDCGDEESQALRQIRDELAAALEIRNGATYAGMRLLDGWAEFYFYAAWSKGAEQRFRESFKSRGYGQIEYGATRDASYAFYRDHLYPDVYALQQIKDREIIDELEEEGDDLSIPRPVEHYLFFQTKAAMQRCALIFEAAGDTVETGLEEEEGEYAHGFVLRRSHAVDAGTLSEVTKPLIDAAEKEHGLYLGWSTTLAA